MLSCYSKIDGFCIYVPKDLFLEDGETCPIEDQASICTSRSQQLDS